METNIKTKSFYNSVWHDRAKACIGQGALTNSKRPSTFVEGVYPTHFSHGDGAYIVDANGNRFLDFVCGLGTSLIGYNPVHMSYAVGCNLSFSSIEEVLVAEELKSLFPMAEKFKLLKTGSEACSAAIKMARAYTGRQTVLSSGYHGWHDEFVSLTPPSIGVAPCPEIKQYSPQLLTDSVAAVIVEPVIVDMSQERKEFLINLRNECTKYGAVLIFDEIITGLRVPKNSIANYWGINPDLICLGKAIGGGQALAAVGGRAQILDGDYFVSSTFAGETSALKVAKRLLHNVHQNYPIQRLWDFGEKAVAELNEICQGVVKFEGYATRGIIKGESDLSLALFFQECCKAGILFGPSYFFCHAHIEEMNFVYSCVRDIVLRIKNKEVKLQGKMPVRPYAQSVRKMEGVKS